MNEPKLYQVADIAGTDVYIFINKIGDDAFGYLRQIDPKASKFDYTNMVVAAFAAGYRPKGLETAYQQLQAAVNNIPRIHLDYNHVPIFDQVHIMPQIDRQLETIDDYAARYGKNAVLYLQKRGVEDIPQNFAEAAKLAVAIGFVPAEIGSKIRLRS